MKGQAMHVAIIGAGIVGVSTAIWLQRAGVRVTLIDREGPAAGTSQGNAGVLAAASIVPIPVPGLLAKAPRMLLDPRQPLFLRWPHLPRLVPFLAPYLASAREHERIGDALSLMLHDTYEQHAALAAGTGAERYLHAGDYVFGYTKAGLAADEKAWGARERRGHPFEVIEEPGRYDPLLAHGFERLVRCPGHGRISDPGAYVRALADHFEREGGRFLRAEVRHVDRGRVVLPEAEVAADEIVVTSGVWSKRLLERHGVTVRMETERGYHIEFVNPSHMPRSPVMVAWGKFVLTPMDGRLRAAGIVEFGGLDDRRSKAPFALLRKQTLEVLPDLTCERVVEWMGHRPSTSDSLPLVGRFADGLWAGFGHQHVGLTAGPKTGRWLARMLTGEHDNTDLAPFAPTRFGARHQTGDQP